jgi:hypothetical protein
MSSQQPVNVPPTWPQPSTTPKSWYQQPRIIIPTIAGVLIACCAGLYILGVNSPSSTSTSSSSAAATHSPTATSQPNRTPQPSPSPTLTATAAPTATTAPTATLGPQIISNAPVIGGLDAAFQNAYPHQTATYNGVTASLLAPDDTGTDGQKHIVAINFTLSAPATDAQLVPFMAHFLPADAHLVRTVSTKNGIYHVYLSRDLAATFPASAFTTESNDPAPAGSLSWNCSSTTFCFLAPGTN